MRRQLKKEFRQVREGIIQNYFMKSEKMNRKQAEKAN
jgi:hypothetical protein